MSPMFRIAFCALFLSGCLILPVAESPQSRTQAERIVAVAYGDQTGDTAQEVDSLAYFFDVIAAHYYREVDRQELADTAMDYLNSAEAAPPEERLKGARVAIVDSLDRHSQFFDRDEFTIFQQSLNGEFVGIGVRIRTHEEGAIVEPLPDSPAMRAGMRKGDILVRAGKKSFKGMDLQQIVEALRGKVGTNVSVGVLRGYGTSTQQKLDFSLRRAIIQQVLIETKTLEDIGYIRLFTFSAETDTLIEKALEDFEKHSLRGYIIDLRSNRGGLLQQAITLADYFLNEGRIVSVHNRLKSNDFSASSYASITQRPVVVLIDGGTASSSEILALALADHHRATIIGEESFGKGTVQTLYGLHGGEGLKLTTAQYASPRGTILIEHGITPNIIIADDPTTEEDEQITAAIDALHPQ